MQGTIYCHTQNLIPYLCSWVISRVSRADGTLPADYTRHAVKQARNWLLGLLESRVLLQSRPTFKPRTVYNTIKKPYYCSLTFTRSLNMTS